MTRKSILTIGVDFPCHKYILQASVRPGIPTYNHYADQASWSILGRYRSEAAKTFGKQSQLILVQCHCNVRRVRMRTLFLTAPYASSVEGACFLLLLL